MNCLVADSIFCSTNIPAIATRILGNLSRELARRLRRTTQDLRNLS
jgi:hypothetical protein